MLKCSNNPPPSRSLVLLPLLLPSRPLPLSPTPLLPPPPLSPSPIPSQLYPSYAYGDPGEQSTRDGTVLCCDLVVTMVASGGGAGEGHIYCDSSSGEGVASGSLPSLEDPSQRVYMAASPTNLPSHSRQDSLDVFSDPRILLARSPVNFHGSSSPPRGQSENGFLDWSSTLHNLEEMTSTESLDKLAACINPEMSPSWSQYMEDNGFPSQVSVRHDDHDSLDQVGTKWRGLDSGAFHHNDPRTAEVTTTKASGMQSNELAVDEEGADHAHHSPPRTRPPPEGSAHDRFSAAHTDGGTSSGCTAQRVPARRMQSSLEALTRLGDDAAIAGGGGSRPEEAGGRYTPRNQIVAAVLDPWISLSDSPSKSDGSPHSQQSAWGQQQGSQELRPSGGDGGGGGGSQNSSELKSRRTNRSYQSQRAQLHKSLGARQSAEGDHPRSNAHLDSPSSSATTSPGGKANLSRRGHIRVGQGTALPGNSHSEDHKHSQDAVLPSFVEGGNDRPAHEEVSRSYHQRVPSNEERHSYVDAHRGQVGRAKRPVSAKVPLQTYPMAETTHVSIDEAIEKASQPNRNHSGDVPVVTLNGLGMRHKPTLEEDPGVERRGGRKLHVSV